MIQKVLLIGAVILGAALSTPAFASSDVRGVLRNVEVRSLKHLQNRVYLRLVADHSLCASNYLGFHASIDDQEDDLIKSMVRARVTQKKVHLVVTDRGDCDTPDTLLRVEGVTDD